MFLLFVKTRPAFWGFFGLVPRPRTLNLQVHLVPEEILLFNLSTVNAAQIWAALILQRVTFAGVCDNAMAIHATKDQALSETIFCFAWDRLSSFHRSGTLLVLKAEPREKVARPQLRLDHCSRRRSTTSCLVCMHELWSTHVFSGSIGLTRIGYALVGSSAIVRILRIACSPLSNINF